MAEILVLSAIFAASALAVGRRDGARCLLAVAGCGAACVLGARAALVDWLHPLAAMGLCALSCLFCIVFALLPSWRHAVASFLGAGAALVVTSAVSGFFVWRLKLTGVFNSTMRDLWYGQGTGELDLHWVLLGGIVLASVGVVADLAVAVTTTIAEVKAVKPEATRRELVASGLRLGGDVTGTEVNTLIFALLGLNFGAALLPLVSPDVPQAAYPWIEVLNRQATAVEVVAALAGTAGLVLAIPLTALIGAVLIQRGERLAEA